MIDQLRALQLSTWLEPLQHRAISRRLQHRRTFLTLSSSFCSFTVLATVALLGFRTGKLGQQSMVTPVFRCLVLAVVMATILDLDQPQQGLTRIDYQELTNDQLLLAAMGSTHP